MCLGRRQSQRQFTRDFDLTMACGWHKLDESVLAVLGRSPDEPARPPPSLIVPKIVEVLRSLLSILSTGRQLWDIARGKLGQFPPLQHLQYWTWSSSEDPSFVDAASDSEDDSGETPPQPNLGWVDPF